MTDPTYYLIKDTSLYKEIQRPIVSFSTKKLVPTADFKESNNIYIDSGLLNQISSLSVPANDTAFRAAAAKIHQFPDLKTTKFNSSDAVKMANLDALTGISQHIHGVLVNKTYDPVVFIDEDTILDLPTNLKSQINVNPAYCDLYGSPGGFVEYLRWRIPKIYSYGLTSRYQDWNLSLVEKKDPDNVYLFERIYGADNEATGDLRLNALDFVDAVKKRETLGVDFVIASGNFVPADWALQLLYAIMLIKSGGNVLIKLADSWSKLMADLIYLTALIFESIEIIKPVTADPSSSERYLWCKSRRDDIDELTELIFLATEENVNGLFDQLPIAFEDWLTYINNFLGKKQARFLGKVISALNGEIVKVQKLNLDRALIIWGISGPNDFVAPLPKSNPNRITPNNTVDTNRINS